MNLLITSVGRRGYLVGYFKSAFHGFGEIHAANAVETAAMHQADYQVVTPMIYDEGYISFLLDYCKKNRISALISFFDIDLPILADARKKFEDIGVQLLISESWVNRLCADKWKLAEFFQQHQIRCHRTWLTPEEAISDNARYPLFCKPRWGMGSIGLQIVESADELKILFRKVKREVQHTYLKYESAADLEQSVIIQERAPGQEHGLDVVNDLAGIHVTTWVKEKIAMRAGETDIAITRDIPELRELGTKIAGLLHHRINLDVDVFWDGHTATVLEMNARFGGGYPFSHLAGANLPLAIRHWLQNNNNQDSQLKVKFDVKVSKEIDLKKW